MRWGTLGLLLGNTVARAIYVLPVAGYIILYSDYFQEKLFPFHHSIATNSWGFLRFNERINLMYYGSWVLLIAFGIYWVSCPSLLRGKRNLHQFVGDIVIARDRTTLLAVTEAAPFKGGPTKISELLPGKQNEKDLDDAARFISVRGNNIGSGAGEYGHDIPLILSLYYRYHDKTRLEFRLLLSLLILGGYGCVLVLPAFDLLVRVLGTHYHYFFP